MTSSRRETSNMADRISRKRKAFSGGIGHMHAPSVKQSGQTPSVKLGQSPSPELLCPMSRSSLVHERDAKRWESKAASFCFKSGG